MLAPVRWIAGAIAGLWQRVHQPRNVATTLAVAYGALGFGGVAALIRPPTSIEGEIGATAMTALATLLVIAGGLGTPGALTGRHWLERNAVVAAGAAALIYGAIIATLHITSSGNRLLQLAFIIFALCGLRLRWLRIRERPYETPDRPTAPTRTA